MNQRTILIVTICGLLTAFLLLSPFGLGMLGFILSPFALMPLFVAVLGFGTVPGLIAGIVTAVIIAISTSLIGGISTFFVTLGPALWVGHMAGLVRQDEGYEEWFPLSQILFRLALLSGVLVLIFGWLSGVDISAISEQVETGVAQFFEQAVSRNPELKAPDAGQLAELASRVTSLLPIVAPASLLLMYAGNLALGARFARARGWILRPEDDIAASLALPMHAVGVLAVAIALSWLGGDLGLIAKIFAGAMGAAFLLVGLAVMHFYTRDSGGGSVLRVMSYVALFFFQFPALIFAALGLAEVLLGLRARKSTPST